MSTDVKRKALSFLLMAVVLTALIAAAVPQLELKPGQSLPPLEGYAGTTSQEPAPAASISINTFFVAALVIVLVVVLAYGSYNLIKGTSWKKILIPTLLIAILVMLVVYIFFLFAGVPIKSGPVAEDILPTDLSFTGPPLGPPPHGLIWLVWIGLAIGISLLGVWFIRRPSQNTSPAYLLELEAERALRELRTGSSLNSVIVRCYIQMSQVLKKDKEIELEQTMTAREFEHLLEARGIPAAPVRQLTELFEAARYGFRALDPADEQKAFDCLNAIVQFSRASQQAG